MKGGDKPAIFGVFNGNKSGIFDNEEDAIKAGGICKKFDQMEKALEFVFTGYDGETRNKYNYTSSEKYETGMFLARQFVDTIPVVLRVWSEEGKCGYEFLVENFVERGEVKGTFQLPNPKAEELFILATGLKEVLDVCYGDGDEYGGLYTTDTKRLCIAMPSDALVRPLAKNKRIEYPQIGKLLEKVCDYPLILVYNKAVSMVNFGEK